MIAVPVQHKISLEAVGLRPDGEVYYNLTPAELYEHAIKNGEASLTDAGAIRVLTGKFTGRSPKDKFIVDTSSVHDTIWWGDINQPVSEATFDHLHQKVVDYLNARDLYMVDAFAGADPTHRMPVRIVSEAAYHALFSWNMFVRATDEELADHEPSFTVLAAPHLQADPALDGTRTPTFIGVNFDQRVIIIIGTLYSGEVKKGIFSVLNYLLPQKDVLPMHCSANMGPDGGTAVFFGLSGTGKTTLSADASRTLIGDDEHGWGDDGVFNFEGGCYAKTINLSAENEPEIYQTTQRFGTILENVVLDENRRPDFDDVSLTQNTRCSYPLHYIPNASESGQGGHPTNILFLTADAFGILPPISQLTPEQAMYHFISGYTAKVAGTERGITEPQATFSACFGAPFMPLHPMAYAELLAEKIRAHGSKVWLVNTGWSGGAYGTGSRIKLQYTRRMVNAALNGELDDVAYTAEPFFGLRVPTTINGVPDEILLPRQTWADKEDYDCKARELAAMFKRNFATFEDRATPEVIQAGPQV